MRSRPSQIGTLKVGVDGPEFHRSVREVLAGVADSWIAAEKFQGRADLLEHLAGNPRAGLFDEVAFDLV